MHVELNKLQIKSVYKVRNLFNYYIEPPHPYPHAGGIYIQTGEATLPFSFSLNKFGDTNEFSSS